MDILNTVFFADKQALFSDIEDHLQRPLHTLHIKNQFRKNIFPL